MPLCTNQVKRTENPSW